MYGAALRGSVVIIDPLPEATSVIIVVTAVVVFVVIFVNSVHLLGRAIHTS